MMSQDSPRIEVSEIDEPDGFDYVAVCPVCGGRTGWDDRFKETYCVKCWATLTGNHANWFKFLPIDDKP